MPINPNRMSVKELRELEALCRKALGLLENTQHPQAEEFREAISMTGAFAASVAAHSEKQG